MILHFDLDKKQLVNPPGTGGIVRAVSFIRGDVDLLEVHFYRDGEEVTGVTNIVAVIKETPGEEAPALAACETWEEGETGYTGEIDLGTVSLDALIAAKTTISLLFELNCFHAGRGPITAAPVKCTVINDLWRGGETDPSSLPDPAAWMPAPLELDAPPENGVAWVPHFLTTALSDGNFTFTQADPEIIPTIEFSFHDAGSSPPSQGIFVTGTDILVRLHTSAGVAYMPAITIQGWFEADEAASALVACVADGDGSGRASFGDDFGPTALSGGTDPIVGTPASQLGQTALVTTTHDGDPYGVNTTYIDRWVCAGLAPYTWQPCDNLSVSPNGTVHRTIPDNSGIPSTYIAYP